VAERLLDDHRFREQHSTHGIEHAARHTTPVLYDRPAGTQWPGNGSKSRLARTSFWCTLRGSRSRNRVTAGGVGRDQSRQSVLEIDEPYLRLALDRCFFPHVLAPATLDRFINLVHTLIRALASRRRRDELRRRRHPDVSIGPCPPDLATPSAAKPLACSMTARWSASSRS